MSSVRGIGVSRENEAIARAIMSLGKTLDFEVVAEGVESEAPLEFLKKFGCNVGQGYFFAKPMDAQQAQTYILKRNGHSAANEGTALPSDMALRERREEDKQRQQTKKSSSPRSRRSS